MKINNIYYLYKGISCLAGLLGLPWFYGHLKSRGQGESFWPRLGFKVPRLPSEFGSPRVWIHGVSVGEILAAVPLVQEIKTLLPQAGLIISTGTETGQALARRHFDPLGALVSYFPLDLPWAVRRYLEQLRPDLFIALESEIWPIFLVTAHQQGVRLALTNARISDITFRRYLKYNRYLIDIINLFEIITTGSIQDRVRLMSVGLPQEKLHFVGNLKIDRLEQSLNQDKLKEFKELLQVQNHPVFLAASTHPGEEETVLASYQQLQGPYPSLLLLLAPRHPQRANQVGHLISQFRLPHHLWSRLKSSQEIRQHPVVVIDTIGDLFTLYGLADVPFVGGSIVPHGGQNILEPAAWGKAPLYGPHLTNFRWAQDLLEEAGAGRLVADGAALTAAIKNLLDHPEIRRTLGAKARDALAPHRGAARRQAELIVRVVGGEG